MKPQSRFKKGDKIGGRYLVHQALMGGMGEVYLCLDLENNHPYALKTFQARFLTNPEVRKLLEEEAAVWVALEKHPNIVRCFNVEVVGTQLFLRLEWVAGDENLGTDLRSWLRHRRLNPQLVLDLTIHVCRGLIHANQKQPGVVHRDLKTENILVTKEQIAKITDWGLAKVVQNAALEIGVAQDKHNRRQSLLSVGGIAGTPPYMAPEQWDITELDQRTDIYAVGCVLFEMLTGRWPFEAATREDFRRQHLEASIPKLTMGDTLSASLNTVIERCLAKKIDGRFATMGDLLQELSHVYENLFAKAPKTLTSGDEFIAEDHTNRGFTYLLLHRFDKALADFNTAFQLDATDASSHRYTNRGIAHFSLLHFEDALVDFSRAIELDPNNTVAYVNRGNINRSLDRYDQALRDYMHALHLNPANTQAYLGRAQLYAVLKCYEEALADFACAIQANPASAETYVARGRFYLQLKRHKDAQADFLRAAEIDPDNTEAHTGCGALYAELEQYDNALASFTRAIELNPMVTSLWSDRGLTYARLGHYTEALADYGRAIELDSSNAMSYYNRGLAYAGMQRFQEALLDFDRAVELNNTLAPAYTDRGLAYAFLQHNNEARANYDRAIELDPDYAMAHLNMGLLLHNMGAPGMALRYLEKAAQLGDQEGAQQAARVRRKLSVSSASQVSSNQLAVDGFMLADSLEAMKIAVRHHPDLVSRDFIAAFEQALAQRVAEDQKDTFKQRLAWLQQVAKEQK